MKNSIILLITLLVGLITQAQGQLWQNNLGENGKHFKDLNTLQLQDGSDDYIVAGTLSDASFTTEELSLIRVENITGNIIWQKTYDGVQTSRGFDITRFADGADEFLAVTGYVSLGGLNYAYIASIFAGDGNVNTSSYFEIGNGEHSQGLHIIYTEKLWNGIVTPGFVMGGFYNSAYDTTINNNNKGFVLRTDLNLNLIWINDVNTSTANNRDYDFINHITETSDGYFITGSITQNGGLQQAILSLKIDANGSFVWQNSYVFGNSQDVGVDAYFDTNSNEIYLLTNYSNLHYFGVTVFNNTTGLINYSKSWNTQDANNLNRYGFKINPAINNPSNLVIHGYEREKNYIDDNGMSVYSESLPFIYEFVKNTGIPTGQAFTYLIPYTQPASYTDYFKFWNGQMPLAYYPDMSLAANSTINSFVVGYRTLDANTTAIELISTHENYLNLCHKVDFELNQFPIAVTSQSVQYASINANVSPFSFNAIDLNAILRNCEGYSIGISESSLKEIKVYPNPVSNRINISATDETTLKDYIILDVQGRIIDKGELLNSKTISAKKLQKGIYFLKIQNTSNQTYISKFIKN